MVPKKTTYSEIALQNAATGHHAQNPHFFDMAWLVTALVVTTAGAGIALHSTVVLPGTPERTGAVASMRVFSVTGLLALPQAHRGRARS